MDKKKYVRLVIFMAITILYTDLSNSQKTNKYLREYLDIGLKNNLELQSAKEALNMYDAKLSQSISNFLPKIDASSRYTRAGGGRSFEFPLGSMLNPIYEYIGLPLRFPDIKESFMRPREQDTKIGLIQPIFNMAIFYNYKAQDNLFESASQEYKAKEINFVYSLKEAYFNYAKALQLVEVQRSAVKLAQENNDVIVKMFKVDKVPKTDILRAEVLLAENQQNLQNAINMSNLSKNFFNTLLNRPFDTEINVDVISIPEIHKPDNIEELRPKISLEQATESALSSKPELEQLQYAIRSAENAKKIMSSEYIPTITLAADYGFQDIEYKFNKENHYWMISGVFSWNLFSGFGTKARVEESEYQINSLRKSLENVKQLTMLEVKNSFIDLQNNIDLLSVAQKRYYSADENYNMVRRRYEEGLSPFISLIDAQTSLDGAKANYIVTYYSTLLSKAKLEKNMGAYYINK